MDRTPKNVEIANRPAERHWRVSAGAGRRLVIAGALLLGGGLATPVQGQCDPMEVAKLLADDAGQGFGWSVAISEDAAIVGAGGDDDRGTNAGAAYVFELIGGVWSQVAKLTASDGIPEVFLGNAVAISGDVGVVGAELDVHLGVKSGSAYVFERIGGVWTETAKLVPADAQQNDEFGHSVAASGTTAIVGSWLDNPNGVSSGSAYVFERIEGTWMETAKLTPDDGSELARFGSSVSISGDAILVGAVYDYNPDPLKGSAYIFERVGDTWTQIAKLTASDGAMSDLFGYSVSLGADTCVVGAVGDEDNVGSAYVFEKVEGTWTETAKLTAPDGAQSDRFGTSVSIDGDTAVVGTLFDDDLGMDSGSAYVFRREGGAWTEAAKLLASDGADGNHFGATVSASGGSALVGQQSSAYAAYVFDLGCACPADVNGDGDLNVLDFVAFQLLWQAGDAGADCDANGAFNVLDFVCFQGLFGAGCE
jgi:FG-GAP repeat